MGYALSASASGSRAVLGGAGATAFVYDVSVGTYSLTGNLLSPTSSSTFAAFVALSGDGGTVLVGDGGSYSIYAFAIGGQVPSNWSGGELLALVPNGLWPAAMALSTTGGVAVIGAVAGTAVNSTTVPSLAYVFTRLGSSWAVTPQLLTSPAGGQSNSLFGAAVSVSGGGTIIAVGEPVRTASNGAFHIYSLVGGTFVFQYTVSDSSSSSRYFGLSLSMNTVGTSLAVGAPLSSTCDAIFVYTLFSSNATSVMNISAPLGASACGTHVSLSGASSSLVFVCSGSSASLVYGTAVGPLTAASSSSPGSTGVKGNLSAPVRFVRVTNAYTGGYDAGVLNFGELTVLDSCGASVALNQPTTMSSIYDNDSYGGESYCGKRVDFGSDGNDGDLCSFASTNVGIAQYWEVDIGVGHCALSSLLFYIRNDNA